jgi:hypothetical protein
MKITEQQFRIYWKECPPVIWTCVYSDLKKGDAKSALFKFLFDETEHLRDLSMPWMRAEFYDLMSKFPEVQAAAWQTATDYYIRHSWRKWLPWNWNK